jgi:WD40 repeat protein
LFHYTFLLLVTAFSMFLSSCVTSQTEIKESIPTGPVGLAGFELVVPTGLQYILSDTATADGRYVITGDMDGSVMIWDAYRGRIIRQFTAHNNGNIRALAVSPDNNLLVSAGGLVGGWELAFWNLQSGSFIERHVLDSRVNDILFLPNSKDILLCGPDTGLSVWSLEKDMVVRRFSTSPEEKINCLIMGPQGKFIYSGGRDGQIKVWNIDSGISEKTLGSVNSLTDDMAMSPDGKLLAAVASQGKRMVWDIESGRLLIERRHNGYKTVDFTADGKYLLFGESGDGEINGGHLESWDIETLEPDGQFWDFRGGISAMFPIGTESEMALGLANGDMAVWDAKNKQPSSVVRLTIPEPNRVEIYGNGAFMVASYSDTDIRIWDIENLRMHKILTGHLSPYAVLAVSGDESRMVSSGGYVRHGTSKYDNAIRLWDLNTGQIDIQRWGFENTIVSLALSYDGNITAASGKEGKLQIRDDLNGLLYQDQILDKEFIEGEIQHFIGNLTFSPNGRFFAYNRLNKIILVDTEDWSVVKTFPTHSSVLIFKGEESLSFSGDGKYLAYYDYSNSIRILNLEKHFSASEVLWDVNNNGQRGSGLTLSPDGQEMGTVHENGEIRIWDLASGRIKQSYTDPYSTRISSTIRYTMDGRSLVYKSNGALHMYSIADEGTLTFVAGSREWLIFDQDGYFDGSSGSGDLLSVSRGLENYRIDQFSSQLNRPDLLMKRYGLGNDDVIAAYAGRAEKRNHNNHQFTGAEIVFDIPRADIKDVIESDGVASLTIEFTDPGGSLDKYSIFVNDVPYLTGDRLLKGAQGNVSLDIPLGSGQNKIEVSCSNASGIESLRDYASVLSSSEPSSPDLYYIGLGVSEYNDPALNLGYAAKDAEDLEHLFSSMGGSFNSIRTKMFLDRDVTPGILDEVSVFLSEAGVDDIVVLFIAGHGLYSRNDDDGYYFLIPGSDQANLPKTAIPFTDFEKLLVSLSSRNKLFLMDTCESGEKDEGAIISFRAFADSRGIRDRGTRGLGIINKEELANPRTYLLDQDRFIFNDLDRESGAIIISSCRGDEFSYESDDLMNGFFTDALISAFNDKKSDANGDISLSTDELQAYVSRKVSDMSLGYQNPTVDRDNIFLDIQFPWGSP